MCELDAAKFETAGDVIELLKSLDLTVSEERIASCDCANGCYCKFFKKVEAK